MVDDANVDLSTLYDERFNFSRLSELGLSERPFVDSTDARFLYLGEVNMPVYKTCLQSVDYRKGLIVVVGEPGFGKTILAKRLYTVLSQQKDIDVAYIPRSSWDSKFEAAQQISSAFSSLDVPVKRGYDSQLEALKNSINESYSKGRNVVIIFDDAQEISPAILGLIHELYNFAVNEKTVQSILFGQPEATEVIRKNRAVWSRVYQQLSLYRFDPKSTVGLVNYRVRVAGRLEPLVDNSAFLVLNDYANGAPRDIVAACNHAFDILLREGGNIITKQIMSQGIANIGKGVIQ